MLTSRNFYKVEKWSGDGMKVDSLLYAGNNLGPATCRQAPVGTRTATCESGGHLATRDGVLLAVRM
jgi:hypothetical protein